MHCIELQIFLILSAKNDITNSFIKVSLRPKYASAIMMSGANTQRGDWLAAVAPSQRSAWNPERGN